MKLVIISICKNEADSIAELINRIPKKINGVDKIKTVIIDDGSTDGTVTIAKKKNVTVVSDNSSKGLAFRFRQATDIALKEKADVMVNIDGDLQFHPEDIPVMVKPVVDGTADFVAADRFTDPKTGKMRKPVNMPFVKYHGNKVGAFIVSRLSHRKFRDVTCGFRAYGREALIAVNTSGNHTYTQESFQVLAAKRMRIVTIPVEVKYFIGRKSRVVTSIPGFIMRSAINILRSYRDFAPLRFFFILGMIPFILGALCLVFVGIHWLNTDSLTPYKAVGFFGIYTISLGIFFWVVALLADMLVRILNNQEKIYEHLKRKALEEE